MLVSERGNAVFDLVSWGGRCVEGADKGSGSLASGGRFALLVGSVCPFVLVGLSFCDGGGHILFNRSQRGGGSLASVCPLYTSDAADEEQSVSLAVRHSFSTTISHAH